MAEQKNHNNELNVEDALTQSEAFLVKNKKAIIGAVVAVIVIVAGAILDVYKRQHLTSAALRQELMMGRELLVRNLNQKVGATVITNIIFR